MRIKLNSLWSNYELIDCGNFKKLERFGEYTLIRPEISAGNIPKLDQKEWENLASAEFIETEKNSGEWKVLKSLPEQWYMSYNSSPISLKAQLSLTNSKHIGIFPEQVINWDFIKRISSSFDYDNYTILNLFAYTGLSSIISSIFTKSVTHVDSIKKIVNWSKINASLSERNNIRFIIEDAQKFVLRELKRNNRYTGIILDPPPIGMGPDNEKWILTEMLDNLLSNISGIMENRSFLIMNLYTHSINDKYIHKLILTHFPKYKIEMCEKLWGVSIYNNKIDHGYFIRLIKT